MKTLQKFKVLILSLGLTACGGSGGTSSTGTVPAGSVRAAVETVVVPLNSQIRTTASVSSIAATSKTGNKTNSCFIILPQSNDKNYTTAIVSGQYWSTAQVIFTVKNNCSNSQAATELPITISDVKINNSAIIGIDSVAQEGSPWLDLKYQVKEGGYININLSTADCEGECSWAGIPAGGTKKFTVNLNNEGPINALDVSDVIIGEHDYIPDDPIIPPATGILNVSINSSNDLISICKSSTCNIKINIISPSGKELEQIMVNPADSLVYNVEYTGLLPGNYTMAVDQNSLPAGVKASYIPATGIVPVYANTASQASIAFNYTTPVELGNLVIHLANVSDSTNFSGLGIINGKVIDNNENTTYSFTTTLGGEYSLNNIPANHMYTISLQGIGNAQAGSYYAPINKSDILVHDGKNTDINLQYVNKADTHAVKFVITGDPITAQGVRFADANAAYRFVDSNILVNGDYVFPKIQQIALTTSAPSGYTLTTNPTPLVITDNVTNVEINYAKQVITGSYDYIAPFKDYNNKIILSAKGVASAKSLEFTSNFKQKDGWGQCFGQQVDNLTFKTIASGKNFVTTISPKTTSGSLNLTLPCDIMGTDSGNAMVLSDVVDPIVYAVKITNEDDSTTNLPIYQPCQNNGCKDPGNGYVNAGYYAQWSVWGRKYNPYSMPFNNINDIIYAFIGFNPATGDIKSLDTSADTWGLSATSRALLQYPYMHAHLSFGGWTNNGINTAPMFEQLASSKSSMENFATQAVELMRKTGFSGIDIDWEWWSDYANNVAPAVKMLDFYKILRAHIDEASKQDGKTYTLTIAVNGGSDRILALQSQSNPNSIPDFWAQVGNLMDYVNVMNYDYHGAWDEGSPAYFQANYDFSNIGTAEVGASEGWSIKSGINSYIANGVPARKLVVGIPLYARTMTVSSDVNGGLLQTVTGAGFGDYEKGILDYKCIVNPVANPETGCGSDQPIYGVSSAVYYNSKSNINTYRYYGLHAMQPWAYNSLLKTFITYDDQDSAVAKTRAVKAGNLGGTMFWELDGDAQNSGQSIIQSVRDELNK